MGFLIGKYRQRALLKGRNLEQYDFYPFAIDPDGFPAFSLELFQRGVDHLLERSDATAAAQIILIGEQNGVRCQLPPDGLARYEKLYARYHGQRVMQDSSEFLQNYRRIVRLLGGTFRGMGIEVLLHGLVNPSRSITCIAGGEVTGRTEGMGTTSLVIDLKRRRILKQDKLNYSLGIGARRFKYTTVPTLREPHRIVGAMCVNIDVNYIRDYVLASPAAIAGKRHWRDEPKRDLVNL